MSDDLITYKMTGYNKFKCTADKCSLTCCEGWDISVDKETLSKWNSDGEETKYILDYIKACDCEDEVYLINKDTNEKCPLLDEKGLCKVVNKNGDEYLTHTCRTFPRIINTIDGIRELSLSTACPEVIEIISNMQEKIMLVTDDINNSKLEFPLNIREAIVKIIQQDNIDIDLKLVIAYEMVGKILNHKRLTESLVIEELNKYEEKSYLKDIAEDMKCFRMNNEEAIEEVNGLFLEMIENYKDVSGIKAILNDIATFAEKVNPSELLDKWNDFKADFKQHDELMENVIVSKVIGNCVNDDVVEIAIGLQLVILEYILVRYATFLNVCADNYMTIDIEKVKNNIVAFSRIIENNSDAVVDFIYDSFDNELLELEYLIHIAIF